MTESRQCEVCHIGTLHGMRATYATWLQNQFVLVPNLPAWLCDVCGEFYYEPDMVARIDILLGNKPVANRSNSRFRGSGGLGSRSIPPSDRSRSV